MVSFIGWLQGALPGFGRPWAMSLAARGRAEGLGRLLCEAKDGHALRNMAAVPLRPESGRML